MSLGKQEWVGKVAAVYKCLWYSDVYLRCAKFSINKLARFKMKIGKQAGELMQSIKCQGPPKTHIKNTGVMAHSWDPRMGISRQLGDRLSGQPGLHAEFQASKTLSPLSSKGGHRVMWLSGQRLSPQIPDT